MEETIKSIIQTAIPKGSIFDAHSIINYLIKYNEDIYNRTLQPNWTKAYHHSEISKTIATFEGNIITRQGECWSMHINNEFCLNKCWVKL